MKKFNLMLVMVFALLFGATANAQDASTPWGITVGAHAVDHTSVRGMFDGFFNTNDYSIVPPLSKISVIRHLDGKFSADLTASVGEIDNKRMMIDDELFINAGLGLRFRILGSEKTTPWFDPYLRVGASYHRFNYEGVSVSKDNPYMVAQATGYDDEGVYPDHDYIYQNFTGKKDYFMVQGGLGVNFWISDNFGINIASDYNAAPAEENDYVNFFQHTAGVTFKFGKKDADDDGIPDDEDECPNTPGLEEFNGCPDTDGDGIRDLDDACPEVAGLAKFNGCPDTDGDGIIDSEDDCPEVAGPATTNGCPDKDSDGIKDSEDDCPNVAGLAKFNGCPDSDGDGIKDSEDDCPNVAGLAKFNGCPDSDGDGFPDKIDRCPNEAGVAPDGCPKAEVMVGNINVGFVVEFDYNKASIRPSSHTKISEKASQIKRALEIYPSMTLYIDGHTDSKGSASYNKRLSQKRAESVVKDLEAQGISEGTLTPRGLGESTPKCTNDTDEGRQCNRRVEATIKSMGEKK